MPLEALQRRVALVLKANRDIETFVGGSSVFNATFPRRSDDIDIYTDLRIGDVADLDVRALRDAGLNVDVNDKFYGFAIEATVGDGYATTKIEWNEADRERFFPAQQDDVFGWTLHKTDLAIQKLVAAASRRTVRDVVDVLLIDLLYCPIEPLAIAAPAKIGPIAPPAILDRILRNAMGHPSRDYESLDLDREAMPFAIRDIKAILSDRISIAQRTIVEQCPSAMPGLLYLRPGSRGVMLPTPAAIASSETRAISERGAIPLIGIAPAWLGDHDGSSEA